MSRSREGELASQGSREMASDRRTLPVAALLAAVSDPSPRDNTELAWWPKEWRNRIEGWRLPDGHFVRVETWFLPFVFMVSSPSARAEVRRSKNPKNRNGIGLYKERQTFSGFGRGVTFTARSPFSEKILWKVTRAPGSKVLNPSMEMAE